jgi:5-methylthioadenosine/S-adenosylhomocysteine deaminase
MILLSSKILPMARKSAVSNEAIVIWGGIIQAIGNADAIIKQFPGHRVYRLKNAVLMPGLVNTHAHLELPPLLENISASNYIGWVLNLLKAKKALTDNDYRSATRRNIQELITTGTTTVAEICTHNVSPSPLKQSGLRGIIFQEIIAMSQSSLDQHRLKSLDPLRATSAATSLLRLGLSPHAPHTVSEAVLLQIKKIAKQEKLPLSMHVAESRDETRLLQGKGNRIEKIYQAAGWDTRWAPSANSSFEYLSRLGLLGPRFLAIHAVQVTDKDISLIRKTRTPVAHCPRSNSALHVGTMPLKKFLDAGVTVGLGTDSLASSLSLNMWDEMRYACRIHKKDGVTVRDIFRLATIGGAKALGLDKEIGTLAPGKKADIIALPLPRKNTGDLYSDLLRETESSIMTMVNGKILFDKSS